MRTNTMQVIGVIPARYASSRFPGKPLTLLLGKPMIIWVAELASKLLGKDNVFVATEDNRISSMVQQNGFNAVLTSDKHLTGTDRLAEVASKINADIYVNIQGDEPTLNPQSIQTVVDLKKLFPKNVINAMTMLDSTEEPDNRNIPKVVFDKELKMIYMSRLPVPGYKSIENKPMEYYKQVCIYAFNKKELEAFGNMKTKGSAEQYEDIEILRFLDLGIPVRMVKVEGNTYAVDVKEDIKIVENRLKKIHCL